MSAPSLHIESTDSMILEIDSERERSAWVKRAEWGVLEEGAHKQR